MVFGKKINYQKYVYADTLHQDGSQTLEFKHDTSHNKRIQIAKAFEREGKEVSLYSDGRLEVRPRLTAAERMERQ